MMAQDRRKLIFLVTEDWYFWSHRLPMARAARDAGFDVIVATRVDRHGERIQQEGFTLHALRWRREDLGPWASLAAIIEIFQLYRHERPLIVHHVALKAALLGGIAAVLAGVPGVVSMIAGSGYGGTNASWHIRAIGKFLRLIWPRLLLRRNCRVIVQNEEDRQAVAALRSDAAKRIVVIRGSGVDLDQFRPLPEPPEPPVTAAYVGRMIAIKGVASLVEAQQKLQRDGFDLRLILAGRPDPANPSSLDEATLARWARLPGISWTGYLSDVHPIWAAAHIAVLGSLGGEGLPKTLLEAASVGRAIVATDVPGTNDVARAGVNALLVPPNDPVRFAAALRELAGDAARRRRFAEAGRRLVEAEFSDRIVAAATAAVYQELLTSVSKPA
jgi:glycosyltransferase involved in cell wall biosynthesis